MVRVPGAADGKPDHQHDMVPLPGHAGALSPAQRCHGRVHPTHPTWIRPIDRPPTVPGLNAGPAGDVSSDRPSRPQTTQDQAPESGQAMIPQPASSTGSRTIDSTSNRHSTEVKAHVAGRPTTRTLTGRSTSVACGRPIADRRSSIVAPSALRNVALQVRISRAARDRGRRLDRQAGGPGPCVTSVVISV